MKQRKKVSEMTVGDVNMLPPLFAPEPADAMVEDSGFPLTGLIMFAAAFALVGMVVAVILA